MVSGGQELSGLCGRQTGGRSPHLLGSRPRSVRRAQPQFASRCSGDINANPRGLKRSPDLPALPCRQAVFAKCGYEWDPWGHLPFPDPDASGFGGLKWATAWVLPASSPLVSEVLGAESCTSTTRTRMGYAEVRRQVVDVVTRRRHGSKSRTATAAPMYSIGLFENRRGAAPLVRFG